MSCTLTEMVTPTPFAQLPSAGAIQIPNPFASASNGLPGNMNAFYGSQSASSNMNTSTSPTAQAAQALNGQLAVPPASAGAVLGTRMTMDMTAQFCLGLALLLCVLTH